MRCCIWKLSRPHQVLGSLANIPCGTIPITGYTDFLDYHSFRPKYPRLRPSRCANGGPLRGPFVTSLRSTKPCSLPTNHLQSLLDQAIQVQNLILRAPNSSIRKNRIYPPHDPNLPHPGLGDPDACSYNDTIYL